MDWIAKNWIIVTAIAVTIFVVNKKLQIPKDGSYTDILNRKK